MTFFGISLNFSQQGFEVIQKRLFSGCTIQSIPRTRVGTAALTIITNEIFFSVCQVTRSVITQLPDDHGCRTTPGQHRRWDLSFLCSTKKTACTMHRSFAPSRPWLASAFLGRLEGFDQSKSASCLFQET